VSAALLPRVGDPAPDFSQRTADGRAYTLADALADGRHALLFFLRHPT
jgi:peroxiredoxin